MSDHISQLVYYFGQGRADGGDLREERDMNYVSGSPYRVPIARLAAAQAALAERGTMMRTRGTL